MGVIWNLRKSVTSSFRRDTMSSGNSSSFSMPETQIKSRYQGTRFAVRIKIIHLCGLFAKLAQKFYCLTQRHRWRPRVSCLWGDRDDHHSPQSSGSSRNILKRLGRSGRSERSYGNQALVTARIKVSSFTLQNTTSLLAGNLLLLYAHTHRRGAATSVRTAGCFILTTGKEKNNCPYKPWGPF